MLTKYIFSAPKGDIPLTADELSLPFRITPSEKHPFLTLGDYFDAVKEFTLKNHGKHLIAVIREHLKKDVNLEDIRTLLIRSEKHGALYHLASVEVFYESHSIILSVSTALSEKGRAFLENEFNTLQLLEKSFNLSYLPKVFFKEEIRCNRRKGNETFSMFLAEWFEDYHEWHLTVDDKEKKQKVRLWDLKNGHRFLSERESFEIFRQASKIVTLYYDTQNFSHIYPWHHAAGDFVVRTKNSAIYVKLTSARNYGPVMQFPIKKPVNPMVAIVYFLMNLTIRMRLDKQEGVGEVIWAEDYSLEASIKGFFEALLVMETEGRYHLGRVGELLSLLKSFSLVEIERLFHSVLELYPGEDPDDSAMIEANLNTHLNQFFLVTRNLRL